METEAVLDHGCPFTVEDTVESPDFPFTHETGNLLFFHRQVSQLGGRVSLLPVVRQNLRFFVVNSVQGIEGSVDEGGNTVEKFCRFLEPASGTGEEGTDSGVDEGGPRRPPDMVAEGPRLDGLVRRVGVVPHVGRLGHVGKHVHGFPEGPVGP